MDIPIKAKEEEEEEKKPRTRRTTRRVSDFFSFLFIMFGWLRDTLATTSPTHSYRHSMIPTSFFHQQQQHHHHHQRHSKKNLPLSSRSSDDDEDDEGTEDDFNDNSFYHNPYHSSGLMNYADLPPQQFTNEHAYPTYLAQQQTSIPSSIDDQIYRKLLSLQQRGIPTDYQYPNRFLSPVRSSMISNAHGDKWPINQTELNDHQQHNGEEEIEMEISPNDDDDDDDEKIRAYYPGRYPNIDEHFDFASVVLWYRNVMQSVKKIM